MGRRFWSLICFVLLKILTISCLKKSSLTFVIDDTVSMETVIAHVKTATEKIMNVVLEEQGSRIEDIVLVTFNDPDAKFIIRAKDPEVIVKHLQLIEAHNDIHNKWCPEYAMTGTIIGLNSSQPYSSLYVFTDSPAEDLNLASSVIDLCQKTQSTVTFILTEDHCLDFKHYAVELKVYYDIANACSGNILVVNKDEILEVYKMINISSQGELTEIKNINALKSHHTNEPFTVDEQVEYVLITATGSSWGLKVFESDNRTIFKNQKTITWLRNTKTLQLFDMKPGTYHVDVTIHGNIMIKIVGRTNFTFEHGFSQEYPKTMDDTTKQPIGDMKNYLSILVSDAVKGVSIVDAEFLDLEDEKLFKMPLIKRGDNFYITAPFMSPTTKFKIAINGVIIKNGRSISRVVKVPIQPQPKPKVIPKKAPQVTISEGSELEIKYGEEVTLTCKVSAYPEPIISWKDSMGNVLLQKHSNFSYPYDYISYLTLHSVKESTKVICFGENELSSKSKSIDIRVNFYEVVAHPEVLTEAKYGTTHLIKCDIRSQLAMKIRWYYKNNILPVKELTTNDKFTVSLDGKELKINFVDMEGTYICEGSLNNKEHEKITFQTDLKIVDFEAPKIEKSRRRISVLVNTTATIKCKVAKGTPKPQVKWMWKPIHSKWLPLSYVGEEFYIPKVNLSHAGTYKCFTENILGKDEVETKLIVEFPPIIKSGRTKYTLAAKIAGPIKLLCDVIGYPKPTISWHEGENLIKSGINYTIDDSGLWIKNLKANVNNFTCAAVNKHGHDWQLFSITVNQVPKIEKETPLITVNVNTSTSIHCKVIEGIPKPNVTWQWLSMNAKHWTLLSHVGEELYIPKIDRSHAGAYKCVAQNSEGLDEFDTQLIVQYPPIILTNVTKYYGVSNDSLRIPCDVIGHPKPTIMWYEQKNLIIPGKNYAVNDGDLLIKTIGPTEKEFKCVAVNDLGKDSKTFKLSINDYLVDYGFINNIFKKHGETPSEKEKHFTCPFSYITPESIRWFSDGFETNVTGPIFKINNFTDTNYTCRVIDEGIVKTYTFVVDVGYAPFFTSVEDTLDWTGSSEEVVNCEVSDASKPSPKIEWFYNRKKLDVKEDEQTIPIITWGWGNYTCRASNVHGSVQRDIIVKSKDCLIKRIRDTLYAPLTLVREIISDEETMLTWPPYEYDNTYYGVKTGENITLSCASDEKSPNSFVKFPELSDVNLICDHQDNFILDGALYKTSDFHCTKKITPAILNTEEKCFGEKVERLQIGFKAEHFVKVYQVCLDRETGMIHSVNADNGLSSGMKTMTKYEWYEHPDYIKNVNFKVYNCSDESSTCCFAKSKLMEPQEVPFSSAALLSTYIENVNAIPEWRPCGNDRKTWNDVNKGLENKDLAVITGASYTSKWRTIPRYLWKLLSLYEETLVVVYVNGPSPTDKDILCKTPCSGDLYDVIRDFTDRFTYCCTHDEYLEKFQPKGTYGYID